MPAKKHSTQRHGEKNFFSQRRKDAKKKNQLIIVFLAPLRLCESHRWVSVPL